jgi:hypothetical protein
MKLSRKEALDVYDTQAEASLQRAHDLLLDHGASADELNAYLDGVKGRLAEQRTGLVEWIDGCLARKHDVAVLYDEHAAVQ